jgi:hypothetical protein
MNTLHEVPYLVPHVRIIPEKIQPKPPFHSYHRLFYRKATYAHFTQLYTMFQITAKPIQEVPYHTQLIFKDVTFFTVKVHND